MSHNIWEIYLKIQLAFQHPSSTLIYTAQRTSPLLPPEEAFKWTETAFKTIKKEQTGFSSTKPEGRLHQSFWAIQLWQLICQNFLRGSGVLNNCWPWLLLDIPSEPINEGVPQTVLRLRP